MATAGSGSKMMKQKLKTRSKEMKRIRFFLALGFALALLAGETALGIGPTALAIDQTDDFIARLSGDQEVPAVRTEASGLALLSGTSGGSVRYSLTLTNIRRVVVIGIYEG